MRTSFGLGDRLEGEKIVCEGRKASKPRLVHGSASHRIQQVGFGGNARAWVEVPVKPLRESRPARDGERT